MEKEVRVSSKYNEARTVTYESKRKKILSQNKRVIGRDKETASLKIITSRQKHQI